MTPTLMAAAIQRARADLCPAVFAVAEAPFALDSRSFKRVPDGATLADIAPPVGAWLCQVDDRFVSRAHWGYAPPRGSVVVFVPVPQGGGGSNPLRTLLTLSLLFIAPSVAPWLKLNGILTGVSSGFIQAGFVIAGQALINNLIPLDQSNAAGGGAQQFNASAQGNVARLDQPIPELFGFDHGWPDLATQPYSTFDGNEQYLHVCLIVGRGQYRIDRIDAGSTPIQFYEEAEVVRVGTGQSTQAGPGTGVETLAEQTLVNTSMVTSTDVAGVEMPTAQWVGPFAACRPERTVDQIHVDVVLPRGLDSSRSITWQVQAQLINDFDQPAGAWVTLATETVTEDSVVPLRLSYSYPVAAGRYHVRVQRTDVRSTNDGSAHDISWLQLRAEIVGDGIAYDDGTYVAIKVRASGQLSGALRFRAMTNRMLPVWDGSAWSAPEVTRNPAWALARVLKARGIADTQIDLDQLLALSVIWHARQDNFDYRFDSVSTTWDALTLIAKVGRAVPLIRGSRYTFARDGQESTPVAHFGMRNIRAGSWRLRMRLPKSNAMEALDVEYLDHRRWDWVTVTAQVHEGTVYGYRGDANRPVGVPAPDDNRRGRIKLPGVIGENHAIRSAVYTLADGYYRALEAEYSAEMDGHLPPPLALVILQHDVGAFGQGGDVADWDAGTLTVETTEPLVWESGATHYLRLMKPTGQLSDAIAVTRGVDDHHAVLSADPGFTPVYDDAGRERTRYVFGPAGEVGALARLRAIKPNSLTEVSHRAVLEDDRVHTADAAWLPGADEQDPLPDGSVTPDPDEDYIVNLLSHTVTGNAGSGDGLVPAAAVSLRNDGTLRLSARRYAAGPTLSHETNTDDADEWVYPHPVTTTITGLYEARATLVAGPGLAPEFYTLAGTFDTWQALDTTREWEFRHITDSSYTVGIRLEIRDIATATVQASAVQYLTADKTPGGGGA